MATAVRLECVQGAFLVNLGSIMGATRNVRSHNHNRYIVDLPGQFTDVLSVSRVILQVYSRSAG